MRCSVPAMGWLFVVLMVLAPVLLGIGAWLGVKALLFVGIVTVAFLILFLLMGSIC